jgi:hypothetical protein
MVKCDRLIDKNIHNSCRFASRRNSYDEINERIADNTQEDELARAELFRLSLEKRYNESCRPVSNLCASHCNNRKAAGFPAAFSFPLAGNLQVKM